MSHLGAALNFISGNIKRSPVFFQKTELEWLWRIYQEPGLWRRYFQDGRQLSGLLFFRVLPYYFWLKRKSHSSDDYFEYLLENKPDCLVLSCKGLMSVKYIDSITDILYQSFQKKTNIEIDCSEVSSIDGFVIAKLFILKKHLLANGLTLSMVNLSASLEKIFYWNCAENLLEK